MTLNYLCYDNWQMIVSYIDLRTDEAHWKYTCKESFTVYLDRIYDSNMIPDDIFSGIIMCQKYGRLSEYKWNEYNIMQVKTSSSKTFIIISLFGPIRAMLRAVTENKMMSFKDRKKVINWIHAKCNISYIDLSNWVRDFNDSDDLLRYIVFDRFADIACTITPIDCITCSSPHDALEILDKFPWAFNWLESYLSSRELLYNVFKRYLDCRDGIYEGVYKKIVTGHVYGLVPENVEADIFMTYIDLLRKYDMTLQIPGFYRTDLFLRKYFADYMKTDHCSNADIVGLYATELFEVIAYVIMNKLYDPKIVTIMSMIDRRTYLGIVRDSELFYRSDSRPSWRDEFAGSNGLKLFDSYKKSIGDCSIM